MQNNLAARKQSWFLYLHALSDIYVHCFLLETEREREGDGERERVMERVMEREREVERG